MEWEIQAIEEEYMEEESSIPKPESGVAIHPTKLLGISLHAIARAPSSKTMRLMGKVGQQIVIVLIDTGNTHSFIDVSVAKRVRLPVKKSHLKVQVANGDTLPCQGYCKVIEFHL